MQNEYEDRRDPYEKFDLQEERADEHDKDEVRIPEREFCSESGTADQLSGELY